MTPFSGRRFRSAFTLLLALAAPLLQAAPPLTVAVMEFAPTRTGPEQEPNAWLSKGISDLLIGDLGRLPELRLVTREHALMLAEEADLQVLLAAQGAMPEEEVRKLNAHLKVDYAVFGTYTIDGDRIKVQAQLINSTNGAVLARFEQDGSMAGALEAEKGLARRMIAFFGGNDRPQGPVSLPAWTDSTAAAKRLYEGVAAFDAGQYNLAWYRFRQALRTDPTYADARYWGARMYYYRQEYDHARLEYRRFVTDFPTHSRVGDAVMEYIHTQEGGSTSPTNLLAVYRAFRERGFKGVDVHNQIDYVGTSPLSDWLLKREQQALVYLGRLGEAYALLDQELRQTKEGGSWQEETRKLMASIAEASEDATGERLSSDLTPYRDIPLTLEKPEAGEDLAGKNLKGFVYKWGDNVRILAPTGYAFKAVKAHIISTGDTNNPAICRLQIRRYRYVDINSCGGGNTNSQPRFDRVVDVTMPPGCTWFYLRPEFDGNNYAKNRSIPSRSSFDAWRIEAEFVPLGTGRIYLNVSNTHEFRALIDGIYTRCYNGSLGALPAGDHTLRVECMWNRKNWGFLPFETNVTVTAGQTLHVGVDLRLTNATEAAGWSDPVGIAREYPTYKHRPHRATNWRNGPPSVSVNPRTGERVAVWAHLDDIWFSVCTNGADWSAPDILPPPVNSAHVDLNPRLILDDRGRYGLLFLSDRGQERNLCGYATWSRDLKAWSRPAQISPSHFSDLDLIQDRDGRYILACAQAPGPGMPQGALTLRTSSDLVAWSEPAPVPLEGVPELVGLRQDAAGEFHLVWTYNGSSLEVNHIRSKDLRSWSQPDALQVQTQWYLHPRSLSLEVWNEMLVVATCAVDGMYAGAEVFTLHGMPLGTNSPVWRPLAIPPSTIVGMPGLNVDPRTKELLLSWQVGDLELNPTRSSGPVYVMAGRPVFMIVPEPKALQNGSLNQKTASALKKLMAQQPLTQKERDDCSRAFNDYNRQIADRGAREGKRGKALPIDTAEHYVQALKMAVIDPGRHGGWPFRHYAVVDAYPELQKQIQTNAEPVRLVAVIIPALMNGKTDAAVQAYQRLTAKDSFWADYITETVRDHVYSSGWEFLDRVRPSAKGDQAGQNPGGEAPTKIVPVSIVPWENVTNRVNSAELVILCLVGKYDPGRPSDAGSSDRTPAQMLEGYLSGVRMIGEAAGLPGYSDRIRILIVEGGVENRFQPTRDKAAQLHRQWGVDGYDESIPVIYVFHRGKLVETYTYDRSPGRDGSKLQSLAVARLYGGAPAKR